MVVITTPGRERVVLHEYFRVYSCMQRSNRETRKGSGQSTPACRGVGASQCTVVHGLLHQCPFTCIRHVPRWVVPRHPLSYRRNWG